MRIPRILIAAPSSGSGKTVLACALMKALEMRGKKVAAYKCGPDYIDPMFHREVLGIDSENLDLFFDSQEELPRIFARHAKEKEIAVIEGVMGYYDGMTMGSLSASSYDVARVTKTPVLLVLSLKGMALSAAALVEGMIGFQKDSNIRGLLLNRTSKKLYPRMKQMLEQELQKRGYTIPVLGYLAQDEIFSLESRHLGLVTPEEIQGLKEQMAQAGKRLAETVDLDAILQIAQSAPALLVSDCKKGSKQKEEKRAGKGHASVLIAVARDKAFGFYYKENLELLKELGCELAFFSPLSDTELPKGSKGLVLGGGYPELYARKLSENKAMLTCIREAVQGGMPCLAECGGFLYLHESLADPDQKEYQMAGVIKGKAASRGKLVRFGYICIEGQKDGAYLKNGEVIRGHEFHYWDSTDNGRDCLAVKPDKTRSWQCIHMEGNLFAGYPHLYLPSFVPFARRFVNQCMQTGE